MKEFNIKSKAAVKYFENNSNQFQNYDKEEKETQNDKIQLDFNLINGKNNYVYGLRLVNPEKNSFNDSFISDFIKCQNSSKTNLLKYSCEYSFGKEQTLNLELMIKQKNGFKSYQISTSIGEIVGSEHSTKVFDINGIDEKLEVKGKSSRNRMKYLTIHFNLKISSSSNEAISEMAREEYLKNEKYKIYFKIERNNNILYESEAFTDDGKFNMVQIPLNVLNSDFTILFFNYKNQNIGKINTNVKQITHPNEKQKVYFQKRLSLTDNLYIYNVSSIKDEIKFLDYLNHGVRLALDIGIDFTGSNGHPDDLGTLHCRLPDLPQRNPYERAILSCAKIMANYDYDQLFPVYGFGAVIKGQKDVSMCFNINFKEDPNIQYVDNIMKEYYACLDKIYFSGPTYFAPIIKKIISDIKKEDDILEYHVLMILTDGKIEDYEDTVDALVEGSFLPLSVIIVGIGDNPDFKYMEQLDGDEIPLISSNGKKRQRDLVQFVPFNKFEGDEKKLTEEVLDEIPRQIIEYYTLNFLYPELLSNSRIDDSINSTNSSYNNNSNNFNNTSNNNFNNYGEPQNKKTKDSKNNNQKESYNSFNNKNNVPSSDFPNNNINNNNFNNNKNLSHNNNKNYNNQSNYPTDTGDKPDAYYLSNSGIKENNIKYNPYSKQNSGKKQFNQ